MAISHTTILVLIVVLQACLLIAQAAHHVNLPVGIVLHYITA